MKKYITTPIYYVNDIPHIGHLYSTIAADVTTRYFRQKFGHDAAWFLVGTDEHGAKVAEAAAAKNLSPQEFADQISPNFQKAWDAANIEYDIFMRTTDPRHGEIVGKILTKLHQQGDIYDGLYEGWYCVGCEKFITEKEIVDGVCPLHPNKKLLYQKEKNYFFRLSKYADQVAELIESNKFQIHPEARKKELLARMRQGVEDVSMSRAGVTWGIQVPWDSSQTVYVWIEALLNYYTATQFSTGKAEFWPPSVQFVGKDIGWFHGVIWPALLLAAGLSLPNELVIHGFFTIDGQKMSKSLGNVIAPAEVLEKFGVDGARYVLMTANEFGNDGDLSMAALTKAFNADLANGLGNLVARTAKLSEELTFPVGEVEFDKEYVTAIELYHYEKALGLVWDRIREADKHLNLHEPWKVTDLAKKQAILQPVVEAIRWVGYHLKPFMPETSDKIASQFGQESITTAHPYFMRLTE